MSLKHYIAIKSYDEASDTFACEVIDHVNDKPVAGGCFDTTIPAFLMPVIARPLCDTIGEDLPFGLVGKQFAVDVA